MEREYFCASCGVILRDGDDAVACEHCGTRYHRHCYNIAEQGICRCRYDKQAIYKESAPTLDIRVGEEAEPVDRTARCISCGAPAVPDGRFCPYCGGLTASPGYSAEEIALIGTTAPEYIRRFEKLRHGGMSWNWWAFLWTPFWCFYRKMYLFGFVSMALQYGISYCLGNIGLLIYYIIIGIIADSVYMGRIGRLSKRAEALYGEEREEFFRAKGGVSVTAAVLLGVGLVLFAFISAALKMS